MMIRAPTSLRKAGKAEHHIRGRVAIHSKQLAHSPKDTLIWMPCIHYEFNSVPRIFYADYLPILLKNILK
jgi:hypothetical protein